MFYAYTCLMCIYINCPLPIRPPPPKQFNERTEGPLLQVPGQAPPITNDETSLFSGWDFSGTLSSMLTPGDVQGQTLEVHTLFAFALMLESIPKPPLI